MATYVYDARNHRIKKTVGDETRLCYFNQQWQCVEERVGTTVDATWIYGLRYIDDIVCRMKNTEVLYALQDPNWNVVALVTPSGTVAGRLTYDSFGRVTFRNPDFTTKVSSSYGWSKTFTGQVYDVETGLMLYRNRYYHTGLGRFITRDPIGYDGDHVNLYRYVENRADAIGDPSGTLPYGVKISVRDVIDLVGYLEMLPDSTGCAILNGLIESQLDTDGEKFAWNLFVHGGGGLLLGASTFDGILRDGNFRQSLEKNLCKDDCSAGSTNIGINVGNESHWNKAIGGASIEVDFEPSEILGPKCFHWTARMHERYDFNPIFNEKSHRSEAAEDATRLVRTAQLLYGQRKCGWKEYYIDSKTSGTICIDCK